MIDIRLRTQHDVYRSTTQQAQTISTYVSTDFVSVTSKSHLHPIKAATKDAKLVAVGRLQLRDCDFVSCLWEGSPRQWQQKQWQQRQQKQVAER